MGQGGQGKNDQKLETVAKDAAAQAVFGVRGYV